MFELGGKCQATRQVLRAHAVESMWDLEIAKLETSLNLTQAFIDAYAWQEKWELAKQNLQQAEEALGCVHEKIKQGKLPPLEKNKQDIRCYRKEPLQLK